MTQITPHPSQESPKNNTVKIVLIGCLGVFLFAVLCVSITAWYVATNIRTIGANLGQKVAVSVINDSKLPDDQKKGIISHIDRVVNDYKAGKITDEQLGQIFEKIAKSPVTIMGIVMMAEEKYVTPSKLTATEKSDAVRTLQRLGRGAYEEKIEKDKIDKIMETLMTTDSSGNKKIKEKLTDEELRAFLKLAKDEADRADVPDEAFVVDMAAEIGKSIEEALHPKESPAATELPAATQP